MCVLGRVSVCVSGELEQTVEYHQYSEMDDSFSLQLFPSAALRAVSLYLSESLNLQPRPDPWSLESIFNMLPVLLPWLPYVLISEM